MKKCLPALLLFFVAAMPACAVGNEENTAEKPPIIDVFACSDYCPGPRQKHMKKVYEGVADAETCLKLGGEPYTYVGWGTHFVCIANPDPLQ